MTAHTTYRDYADLTPDDLERQIAVSRDAATLYHASVVAAEIELRGYLASVPRAGRLLSDLEAAAVARDRAERRVSRLMRELESRKTTV